MIYPCKSNDPLLHIGREGEKGEGEKRLTMCELALICNARRHCHIATMYDNVKADARKHGVACQTKNKAAEVHE